MPCQYPGFYVLALLWLMNFQILLWWFSLLQRAWRFGHFPISRSKVYLIFSGVGSLPFETFPSSLLCVTFPSTCLNMIPDAGSPFLGVQSALWQIVTWPQGLLFFVTLYPLTLADTLLNSFCGLSGTVSLLEYLTTPFKLKGDWVFRERPGHALFTPSAAGAPRWRLAGLPRGHWQLRPVYSSLFLLCVSVIVWAVIWGFILMSDKLEAQSW